ncbi:GNAT family N-acetyltransferase [Halobellus rufus]|uniref:GNAT family N-acetyltransferase n=1 Tax=Halobellus rufus TaxID=1448860 RepID=UPI000ADB1C23
MTVEIRESTPDDADDVVNLLDAAMLEFDRQRVRRLVADGEALVAVDEEGAVVGACVLGVVDGDSVVAVVDSEADADADSDPSEIESIAVRRSRRGRGIGRALVDAAATRAAGPLVARFREQVRPFYAALGFEIRRVDGEEQEDDGDDRLCGILR